MKKGWATKRKLVSIAVSSLCMLDYTSQALAGAYQLSREYNAVEIGDSGAGGAAIADDASTAFANPAGLVRIPNKQIVIVGDGLSTSANFKGSNTWSKSPFPPYTQTGNTKTDNDAFIPSFFYAQPLNFSFLSPNTWNFGFGTTIPFGLSTQYPNTSVVRYSATISKLQVFDISPNLSYKYNDKISVGFGLDFNRVGLITRNIIGAPVISTALDTSGKNSAYGWGYGGHAGLLFQLSPTTRFGLTYHGSVLATLKGNSMLTGPLVTLAGVPSGQITSSTLRTKFVLPPSVVASAYHEFNSKWSMDGSAYYTQWTRVSGIQTSTGLAPLPPATAVTLEIPQHYKNTWLLALGGGYQLNPSLLLRTGISYDQSPVKSFERYVFLPDSDRIGLSIGANYTVNKYVNFDAGWMHLFFRDSNVSAPLVVGSQTSVANGSYNNSHIDVVGLQMNLNIV